jgi:hypothetical protein
MHRALERSGYQNSPASTASCTGMASGTMSTSLNYYAPVRTPGIRDCLVANRVLRNASQAVAFAEQACKSICIACRRWHTMQYGPAINHAPPRRHCRRSVGLGDPPAGRGRRTALEDATAPGRVLGPRPGLPRRLPSLGSPGAGSPSSSRRVAPTGTRGPRMGADPGTGARLPPLGSSTVRARPSSC